jgi:hypothetical protein
VLAAVVSERYLMTTTREAVPCLVSLVAVTVTVPRSTPVSLPVTLSTRATAASLLVQRTAGPVSTLLAASRSTACSCTSSYASSVSSGVVTVTVATGALTDTASVAVLPSLVAVSVLDPLRSAVSSPLTLSMVATIGALDVQRTVRPVSTAPSASFTCAA